MIFSWKMCSAAKKPSTIYIISREQEWIQPPMPTGLFHDTGNSCISSTAHPTQYLWIYWKSLVQAKHVLGTVQTIYQYRSPNFTTQQCSRLLLNLLVAKESRWENRALKHFFSSAWEIFFIISQTCRGRMESSRWSVNVIRRNEVSAYAELKQST